jgi:hypothetical protein
MVQKQSKCEQGLVVGSVASFADSGRQVPIGLLYQNQQAKHTSTSAASMSNFTTETSASRYVTRETDTV